MQLNIENNVANIPDGYSEHVANRVLYAPSRSKNSERYDCALRSLYFILIRTHETNYFTITKHATVFKESSIL